jgi:hypothetical protein
MSNFLNDNVYNCETGKPVNGNNKGSVLFIWSNKFDKVSLINRSDLYKLR